MSRYVSDDFKGVLSDKLTQSIDKISNYDKLLKANEKIIIEYLEQLQKTILLNGRIINNRKTDVYETMEQYRRNYNNCSFLYSSLIRKYRLANKNASQEIAKERKAI